MILSDKDPFGMKAWREFLNQQAFLFEHNLSLEDVQTDLDIQKAEMIKAQKEEEQVKYRNTPLCPECATPLQLLPVNDTLATQTGDDSKTVWLCRACLYERFSTNTIEEELKWLEQE